MNCGQSDGGTKVHLSSVAINVKSWTEIMVFIKSECIKTESLRLCVCSCMHMLVMHSVATH